MRWLSLVAMLSVGAAVPALAREASERPSRYDRIEEKVDSQAVASTARSPGQRQREASHADRRVKHHRPFSFYGK